MQDILVVVDMQNDFIDGTLGTKEAVAIVPKVEEKIRNFKGTVLFTRDTHETSVSYTHLDVYKRQVFTVGIFMKFHQMRFVS